MNTDKHSLFTMESPFPLRACIETMNRGETLRLPK